MDTPKRASIGAQRNPESEEAILRAAEELVHEGGLAAFSIEAVARRAKAGKPTIYRWWPDKSALLLDVYRRQKNAIPQPDTGNTADDLKGFLLGLMQFWKEGPAGAIFRSLVAEAQLNNAARAGLHYYIVDRQVATGELVSRGQARGEVDPSIDPVAVAELLASLALVRLLTDRLDMTEAEADDLIGSIMSGIRNQ